MAVKVQPLQASQAMLGSLIKRFTGSSLPTPQLDSIEVGSKVRATCVRDRIPQGMVELLKTDAFGTVTEFRTVDGKGIGVIVELSDGSSSWFFEDEIVAA